MTGSSPQTTPTAIEFLRGDDATREVLHAISRMVADGLPLADGLRALSLEVRDRALRRSLAAVAEELESGRSLNDAISAHAGQFPAHWRALLEAGEAGNQVGALTSGLISDQELGAQIKREMTLTLVYPLALLSLCVVLFIVTCVYLGRDFGSVFRDFGISLPWITVQMIDASEQVAKSGPWLLVGPALLVALVCLAWRFLLRPDDRSRFASKMPLVGPLFRFVAMSDLCRVLSALLRARLPITESLELAAQSVRDPALAGACRQVASALSRGDSIETAIKRSAPFPPGFARYLGWASTLPNPEEAVALASSLYEERARAQGRFVSTFFTTLALVFALWWTALAATLLLWPTLMLLSKLV